MTFDNDVRLERAGTVTIACSIGKHRVCNGWAVPYEGPDASRKQVPCDCPCHRSNSDKDPVAANERLREAQAVNAAAEGEHDA